MTYDATDNGDGTFTIHDLPIVGPMDKGEKHDSAGEAPGTDRAWMERVIANHLAQLISGYAAPLHDGHHGFSEAPPLGTFVPLCVRDMLYEGKKIAVLCGDVTVDAGTFARIQAGEFPYRSIEVSRWNDALITSLAFMSGSAPYWRFPMLRSLRVTRAQMADSVPESATLRAMFRRPRAEHFVGASARLRARSLARLEAISRDTSDEGGGEADQPADKMQDPYEKKAQESAGGEGGEQTPGAEKPDGGGAVMKSLGAIMQLMTRIAEALLGDKTEDRAQPTRDENPNDSGNETGAEESADENEEDTEDESEKDESKEKAKMAQTTVTLDSETKATLAALTGKVAALEASNATLAAANKELQDKFDAKQAEIACKDAVAAARTQLRAARVVVPADFDATAARMHAAGKETFDSFVATLASTGRRDPPDTYTDALGLAGVATDDPALAPYSAKSPAVLEAAKIALGQYRAYMKATPDSRMTAAEYLKINVKA